MSNYAPLGVNWLPWHFQRIFNFSEFLKLNGYFSNYGFSIWSTCTNCSLDPKEWSDKIYLSATFFNNFPYIFINHYFGSENLKIFGHFVDKFVIFFSGVLIAELYITFTKKKRLVDFFQAIIIFTFFIINPWTYKMLIAHWSIIYFVLFYLLAIMMFLNKKQNTGLLLFIISGLFNHESSTGLAVFYVIILTILYISQKENLIRTYFPGIDKKNLLNYKIIISLILPLLFYFILKSYALSNMEIFIGSSILERIGISGNDLHNGGIIGSLQFLSGNRISKCIVNSNALLDKNNLLFSIFSYNCILSIIGMFLISLISIFGLFIFYKNHILFFKLIIFPFLFLLLSYLFLLQQSSSVHLMGYSFYFSAIFSIGITAAIFSILKKYNYSAIVTTISIPTVIGIILLCIRINMLTGTNG